MYLWYRWSNPAWCQISPVTLSVCGNMDPGWPWHWDSCWSGWPGYNSLHLYRWGPGNTPLSWLSDWSVTQERSSLYKKQQQRMEFEIWSKSFQIYIKPQLWFYFFLKTFTIQKCNLSIAMHSSQQNNTCSDLMIIKESAQKEILCHLKLHVVYLWPIHLLSFWTFLM